MIFAIDVVGRSVCGVCPSLSLSLLCTPQVKLLLLVLLLDDYGWPCYYAGRHPE